MTDVTSQQLCFRHIFILTNFLVCLLLFRSALGAPVSDPSLTELIKSQKCVFPPANINIPLKCSNWTLNSQVDNIEFDLCAALLDSTNRLCHLVTRDKKFGERVTNALNNEGLPSLVCEEMNLLDPNTTMVQAKKFYKKMKPKYCSSICCGVDEVETSVREPVCRSIQFAHQQIRTAIALQKSLNLQERNKNGSPPVANAGTVLEKKPAAVDESQTSVDSGLSHKPTMQPKIDSLKGTTSTQVVSGPVSPKAASNNTKQPLPVPNVAEVGPPVHHQESGAGRSNVEKSEPPQQNLNKPGIFKEQPVDKKNKQLDLNGAQGDVLGNSPAETESEGQLEAQPDPQADPQTDPQADLQPADPQPADPQPADPQPADPQVDAQADAQTFAQGEAPAEDPPEVPGETQGEPQSPSLTDNDDGADENMRQFEDDDEIGPKVQDTNKDFAEKSPIVIKKSSESNALLPSSQQKNSQGRMTGGLNFEEAEDSHFFAYFMTLSALCILGYLVYHNKRKIIAMAVEGKKGRNSGRRRPNSASYHKLDSNLEEAMSSNLGSTNSYVIY
ncbi:trans-Golgi network integral membrane protein 2 isoform X2 [Frankliniella occidentalis]|uniref:Trans-Golgi network integral membrane protein 2 isoform X2 n=1 Tax=Frankliniella occidentalis TaxID=133901 RepID=A0A9C6TXA5_FRAOC|nr:trans-Golgi network integral membrane protein 2 isoform X2 [Frankliniella occidentalis]